MLRILALTILSISLCFSISAEERNFTINNLECDSAYTNSGRIFNNFVDFRYDDEQQKLYIEADLISNDFGTPNGFTFAITSESTTLYGDYKFAEFYVDASKVNFSLPGVKTPKLNSFIFPRDDTQTGSDCNLAPGSYTLDSNADFPSEAILPGTSGYGGNPVWVEFADVSRSTISGVVHTRFSIIIDTKPIEDFVPNPAPEFRQKVKNGAFIGVFCGSEPDPSKCPSKNKAGRVFDFGNPNNGGKISLEFVPVVITTSAYNGSGQLTNLQVSSCNECVINNDKVNYSPTCELDSYSESIRVGEKLLLDFSFSDNNLNDTYTVNYNGTLPAGASATPGQDDVIGIADEKSAIISWTPSANDIGSYSIAAQVIQQYGNVLLGASDLASCTANVEVLAELGPVCKEHDLSGEFSIINNNLDKLKKLLLKANRQLKRYNQKLNIKKNLDFENDINTKLNDALAEIKPIPSQFVSCSERFSACKQTDYGSNYTFFMNETTQIYCNRKTIQGCSFAGNLGVDILKKWRSSFTKFLIKIKGLDSKTAKLRAKKKFKRLSKKASNFSSTAHNRAKSLKANTEIGTIDFECN